MDKMLQRAFAPTQVLFFRVTHTPLCYYLIEVKSLLSSLSNYSTLS